MAAKLSNDIRRQRWDEEFLSSLAATQSLLLDRSIVTGNRR
jgi:hypothetical protein